MNTTNDDAQEDPIISNADGENKAIYHIDDANMDVKSSLAMAIRASCADASHHRRQPTKREMDVEHLVETHNAQENKAQLVDTKTPRVSHQMKQSKALTDG